MLPLVSITACDKGPDLADRQEVYSEFFESVLAGSYLETLVLRRRSSVNSRDRRMSDPQRWELFRKELPSLQRNTYDDFWNQNSSPSELALNKAANLRVQLLSEQQWESVEAGDPVVVWNSLRDRFQEPVHRR